MTFTIDKSTWTRVKFGDVVRKSKEKVDPTLGEVEYYVAGEHMETDNLHIDDKGIIGDGYLGPAFHMRFHPGQVLYGSRRTYLRKVAYADFDGVCANTTFVLETADEPKLAGRFLPFVMQAEPFHEHAIAVSKGSTNPYVNWPDIAAYEFLLPPIEEQHRIADLLWSQIELLQNLSALRNSLRAIRLRMINEVLREVPLRRLEELTTPGGIQIGPFGSQLHASDYVSDGNIGVVMPKAMDSSWVINDEKIAYIDSPTADRLERHKLEVGDIVLPRRGDLTKRLVVTESLSGWICGTGSVRIRLRESTWSKYAQIALDSDETNQWLADNAVGTTMPNLNTDIVSSMPVPDFSAPEFDRLEAIDQLVMRSQQQIASEVDVLSSLVRDVLKVVFGGSDVR